MRRDEEARSWDSAAGCQRWDRRHPAGTDPEAFEEALEAFAEPKRSWTVLARHSTRTAARTLPHPPRGRRLGENTERRFGRIDDGVFFGFDSDEENEGGTLRQLFSNGTFMNGDTVCTIPVETEPASANVRNVGRRTQPLFGLGLVDALPDSVFDANAARQRAAVRGVAQRVPVSLPDPRDPSQSIGSLRVGRFGWKGLVPSLLVFSGDAYARTRRGSHPELLQRHLHPRVRGGEPSQQHPATASCNGGDLAPAQPPGNPQVPEVTRRRGRTM